MAGRGRGGGPLYMLFGVALAATLGLVGLIVWQRMELAKIAVERELLTLEAARLEIETGRPAATGETARPKTSSELALYDPKRFHGTVWRQMCPGMDPPDKYVKLRADGDFEWSRRDGDYRWDNGEDKWRIQHGKLVLVWTDGFATYSFRIESVGQKVLHGTRTSPNNTNCPDDTRLERLR